MPLILIGSSPTTSLLKPLDGTATRFPSRATPFSLSGHVPAGDGSRIKPFL